MPVRRRRANLVIKEQNPWKMFFWFALAAILVSVSIVVTYNVGYDDADIGIEVAVARNKSNAELLKVFKSKLREKKDTIRGLRTEVARLESLNRIDGHAHKKVKETLEKLRRENFQIREELQFYRNIVSPNASHAGLRIHSFKIDEGSEKGLYYYKLTLIQIHGLKNRHHTVSGVVNMYISGLGPDGSRKTIRLKDVSSSEDAVMKFSMKYYKSFEGKLVLPEGFRPRSVRVQVVPNRRRGRSHTSIEKRIAWPIKST